MKRARTPRMIEHSAVALSYRMDNASDVVKTTAGAIGRVSSGETMKSIFRPIAACDSASRWTSLLGWNQYNYQLGMPFAKRPGSRSAKQPHHVKVKFIRASMPADLYSNRWWPVVGRTIDFFRIGHFIAFDERRRSMRATLIAIRRGKVCDFISALLCSGSLA